MRRGAVETPCSCGSCVGIHKNKSVSDEISEIMSSSDGKKKKSRRLKALLNNCNLELTKAHIEYYTDLLRKERHKTVQRIMLSLFSLSYLIFTLCRVWWYYHPNTNPFPEMNYTVTDLIQVIYLLTIICVVLCGVRKAVSTVNKRKR